MLKDFFFNLLSLITFLITVSDLKVELKRRNLPVSGSKPQLIERLKPFTESSSSGSMLNSNGPHVTHMGHILMDTPGPITLDESSSQARSPSSVPVKDEPYSPRMDSPPGSEHDDPSSPLGESSFFQIFSPSQGISGILSRNEFKF